MKTSPIVVKKKGRSSETASRLTKISLDDLSRLNRDALKAIGMPDKEIKDLLKIREFTYRLQILESNAYFVEYSKPKHAISGRLQDFSTELRAFEISVSGLIEPLRSKWKGSNEDRIKDILEIKSWIWKSGKPTQKELSLDFLVRAADAEITKLTQFKKQMTTDFRRKSSI